MCDNIANFVLQFMVVEGGWEIWGGGAEGGRCVTKGSGIWRKAHGQK